MASPARKVRVQVRAPTAAALVAFCACAAGCAASPAIRAAEQGNQTALRAAILARERAGTLSNSDASTLARAVAARDIRDASGEQGARRIRDLRPCARELDDALAIRSRLHDAAGAQAALVRVDDAGLDPTSGRAFTADPDPAWRAVGARSLVGREDRTSRLRALVDPDPRVRREAARAARDARDPSDLDPLAEAARLDPEALVRTEAVRSIAALPVAPDGRTVSDLRDLWAAGDDALREDIARAWSGGELWAAGGRDALLAVVATDRGPGAVEGAAAALRHTSADAEIVHAAVARLAEAIESGPFATRVHALGQAPLGREDLFASVRASAADTDMRVRVAALALLAQDVSSRSKVLGELERLASPESPVAARALLVLAGLGDRRVQAWIERDLQASHPEERLAAAIELAALGVSARGAIVLADDDPTVRVGAACTIILGHRRH